MIYIALFRGLNVGGNHKVKMADLVAFLNHQGGEKTKHYIQSGNLVFHHDEQAAPLAEKLETAFTQKFGFESQIILRSLPDLQDVQKAYPFEQDDREQKFMMTGFARKTPNADALDVLKQLATAMNLSPNKVTHSSFTLAADQLDLKWPISIMKRNWAQRSPCAIGAPSAN